MRFSVIAVVNGLLLGALAAPTTTSKRHVVHERREAPPAQWKRDVKLHHDTVLPIRIALKQNNLHRANEFLMDVSDPESPNFGKHWTAKQVADTFAPTKETVDSVRAWLIEHGFTEDQVKQSQGLNWIHVDATVAEAESLLKTKYYKYTHSETGQAHVACENYSVPEHIRRHIDFVTPTVHFDAKISNPKKKRSLEERAPPTGHKVTPGIGHSIGSPSDKSLPKLGGKIPFGTILDELKHCDTSIVPDCLRALYLLPPNVPANSKSKLNCFYVYTTYRG